MCKYFPKREKPNHFKSDNDRWQRICSSTLYFYYEINSFKLCDWLKHYFFRFLHKDARQNPNLPYFLRMLRHSSVPKNFEGFTSGKTNETNFPRDRIRRPPYWTDMVIFEIQNNFSRDIFSHVTQLLQSRRAKIFDGLSSNIHFNQVHLARISNAWLDGLSVIEKEENNTSNDNGNLFLRFLSNCWENKNQKKPKYWH